MIQYPMKNFINSKELKEIQESVSKIYQETISLGKTIYTDELEKHILSTIIKSEKEDEPSYRYLIYNVLDTGHGSYAPLQIAGILDFHNKFYDNSNFLSDYIYDFSGKNEYELLSEDLKIALISYIFSKNKYWLLFHNQL